MPARTTLLIIFLTLFTSGLVVYSLILDAQKKAEPVAVNLNPTPQSDSAAEKTATLEFQPEIIMFNPLTGTVSARIVLDPQGAQVSGVQVELSYDPTVITQIRLATPSGTKSDQNSLQMVEIYQNVDQENGRISYLMGTHPNGELQTGSSDVVELVMRINPQLLGSGTEITFLDRSLVTTVNSQESILGSTENLQVIPSVLPTNPPATESSVLNTPSPDVVE